MGASELKAEINVANFPRINQILVSAPLKCPYGSRFRATNCMFYQLSSKTSKLSVLNAYFSLAVHLMKTIIFK